MVPCPPKRWSGPGSGATARGGRRGRHHAQLGTRKLVIVRFHALGEGEKHYPFPIRRKMGKPVLQLVTGDLLSLLIVGAGAIGRDTPDVPTPERSVL